MSWSKRQTFDQLPFTVVQDATRGLIFACLLLATIAFAVFLLFLVGHLSPDVPLSEDAPIIPLLAGSALVTTLFVAGSIILRIVRKRKQRIFHIDTAEVICQDSQGQSLWSVPTRSYDCIHWREEWRTTSGKAGGGALQCLYLVHRDPERTFQIIQTPSLTLAAHCCRAWADALELEIVQEVAGHNTVRQPEDFDRSILTLADQGKLDTAFDPDAPPPPGVEWQRDGDRWQTTLRIVRSFSVAMGAGMGFAGFIMMLVGLNALNNWIIATGMLLGLLGLAAIARPFVARRRLILTPEQATTETIVLGLALRRRAIPLAAINRIYTTEGVGHTLILESPHTRICIPELHKDHAQWLAPFATAAIVHLTRT